MHHFTFAPPAIVQEETTHRALHEIFEAHRLNPDDWLLPYTGERAHASILTNWESPLTDFGDRLAPLADIPTKTLIYPPEADRLLLEALAPLSPFHAIQQTVAKSCGGHAAPYAQVLWTPDRNTQWVSRPGLYYGMADAGWHSRFPTRFFPEVHIDAALQTYFLYFRPLPPPPPTPRWFPLFKTDPHDRDPRKGGFDGPVLLPWAVFALAWMDRTRAIIHDPIIPPPPATTAPLGPHLPVPFFELITQIPSLRLRRTTYDGASTQPRPNPFLGL